MISFKRDIKRISSTGNFSNYDESERNIKANIFSGIMLVNI